MRLCVLASGTLCLLSTAGALAQSKYEKDSGSNIRIPKRAEAYDRNLSMEELGREIMNQFARCIIDRRSTLVARAIASLPGEDDRLLKQASTSECLDSGSMNFKSEVLRGAIFGELYRRHQNGSKDISEKFPIQPLDWSAAPSAESGVYIRMNFYLLSMADCVSKSNEEAMRSIVMNRVGSSAQKAAYVKVVPALGPCVPQGQKLSISPAMLEAAFGEYLYRSLVPAKVLAQRGAD